MGVKAVVFDVGGVLERTPSTGWQARWARELGLSAPEFDRRLDPIWSAGTTGEATLEAIERRTGEVLGLDQQRLRALMDDAWSEYLGTLNTELATYFAALRPRYRTAILSNSWVGARERERSAYGFEDICDLVVYSHEEGMMKPDPRFYRTVCDRLAVRPEEVAFLDDTEAWVAAALELGMRAVKFVSTEQAIGDLERLLTA